MEDLALDECDFQSTAFGLNATVKDYFHPDTLSEILKLKKYFRTQRELDQNDAFIQACALHILHGNRPYALSRNSHPITPFAPTGPYVYKSVRDSLTAKVVRALEKELSPNFRPGTSYKSDFRNAASLISEPVDIIITSPPFIGLRFDRPNWLRLWFCGWSEHDFKNVSSAHLERQQSKDLSVYRQFFEVCSSVSKTKAPLLVHVGGSKFYNMIDALKEYSKGTYTFLGNIGEDVSKVANHGMKDKGLTTKNHILVFQKT